MNRLNQWGPVALLIGVYILSFLFLQNRRIDDLKDTMNKRFDDLRDRVKSQIDQLDDRIARMEHPLIKS